MEYLLNSEIQFYDNSCCFLGYKCEKCDERCERIDCPSRCNSYCGSYCKTKTYCPEPQSAGASPTSLRI